MLRHTLFLLNFVRTKSRDFRVLKKKLRKLILAKKERAIKPYYI